METEIIDQQHDQNDVVEFEPTEGPAKAENATVNYVSIENVQNMYTATKVEQIGLNSLHIQGNFANSKSTSYTTNYINIENVHQHPAITSGQDEATNSATGNQTIEKATLKLKGKLQQFYQDATLPCVAWLDTGEDLIMSNYYTELELDSSKTTIKVNQIFDNIDETEPKRILIEGQPGYGKTTLVTKLIYDWAVHEKYIKHFKLAFLLPLRELRKRSIEQAMTDIANLCGFNNNSCLKNILRDNISNILLIVDGLDELAVTDRMPILKLLYKQEYAQITVIVTCRTGSFTPQTNEMSELFGGFSKKKGFYDKRAEVLGIAIENRKEFLLNFIPNENAEDIITEIEKLTDAVKEMFKSPLFLILLAFIASNKNDVTALTTKTDLFKRLFNCIINRSLKTEEINKYDLFHIDSSLNKVQYTIQQYGKRALDQLVNGKMQFDCDKLTEEIYQLGFLIMNKQMSGLHSISQYEAFHRSILEFAAAFSLWINFKQNPSSTNAFHHIQSIYPQLDQTSLVVPFLIGLLQDEACHFFNQFTSHAHLFSANEEIFWCVLAECPTKSMWNKLLPFIIPFIPAVINHRSQPLMNMQLPDFFKNVIQVGIENNQIKIIRVSDAYSISRLPKNVTIPCLKLMLQVYDEKLNDSLKTIQCKDFLLVIVHNNYDGDLNILKLFTLNFAQYYYLNLYIRNFSKLIYQHIDDDFVKQIQLTRLVLYRYSPILKDLIPILLQRNQVQSLYMHEYDNLIQLSEYNKIISAASNSSYLQELDLEWRHSDKELVIDLFDLTQGGKKKYHRLSLKNCQIVSKKEIQDKDCFRSITIDNDEEFQSKQCVEGLNAIEPEVLECDLSVFHQLSQSWKGYATINQLDLHLKNNSFANIKNWSFLSNCKNIKKLTLQFLNGNEFPVASVATMNEILKYMQQLPIEQFGISHSKPDGVAEKLCKCIAKSLPWRKKAWLWMKKAHPLTSVNFTFGEDKMISTTTLDFLECLKLGYLKTINFDCDEGDFLHEWMRLNLIDHSVFCITYSFPDEHRFCIKLKDQNC